MPIEQHFNGDSQLLNQTVVDRNEVRRALAALQKSLQRIETVPSQVTAEIRLNVSGPTPREHIYTISITDSQFDSELFARTKTPAKASKRSSDILGPPSTSSPSVSGHDRLPSSQQDDFIEVRPFKRTRVEGEPVSNDPVQQRLDEIISFAKKWQDEWKHQGGWLFDKLNGNNDTPNGPNPELDKKLDSLQDILGASINSASATTMSELSNITKLLPWLEHCRKTHADKVQAREEKWRSSSATFHDQSRKEREAAEKRLDDRLEAQQRLLVKIAEANGIDLDEIEMPDRRSRESSLGAQLTAELNMEATRAADDDKITGKSHDQLIRIDD